MPSRIIHLAPALLLLSPVRAEPPVPGPWELIFAEEFDADMAAVEGRRQLWNGPSGHILCNQ